MFYYYYYCYLGIYTITSNKKVDFPCSICNKNVNNNHLAIECTHCNLWSHIKCNKIDKKQNRDHQLDPDFSFCCLKCKEDIIPFMGLNDYEFDSFIKKDGSFPKHNIKFTNFTLSQQEMFNKLNQGINEYNTRVINEENESDYNQPVTCNYNSIKEFTECKFNTRKTFSIMHLNIHSIQLHIDELKYFLNMLEHTFDIVPSLKVN